MALPVEYLLATDVLFRELSNFTTPPRAGRITAIESNGQVRVATDDPDGGDVLAWPLNGFTYAVDDVVYVAFAVNHPESALVIGSKGSVPVFDAGEDGRILAEGVRARDSEGLKLEDDGGNLGLYIEDGGQVGNHTSPAAALDILQTGTSGEALRVRRDLASGSTNAPVVSIIQDNSGDDQSALEVTQDGSGLVAKLVGTQTLPRVHVEGQATSGSTAGIIFELAAYDGSEVTTGGFFLLTGNSWTFGTHPANHLVLQSERANGLGLRTGAAPIIFFQGNASPNSSPEVARLADGQLGLGTDAPQGLLHVEGSAGRWMCVEKTGITNVSQTIIADGAGDVTRALMGMYVLSDGSSGVANSLSMTPSDTHDISVGGSTWRLTLSAAGALTVARTAGSGTASLSLMMTWI